jgi:hypothetical protein
MATHPASLAFPQYGSHAAPCRCKTNACACLDNKDMCLDNHDACLDNYAICSTADDACNTADDTCSTADGACSTADDTCSIADGACSIATDAIRSNQATWPTATMCGSRVLILGATVSLPSSRNPVGVSASVRRIRKVKGLRYADHAATKRAMRCSSSS